MECSTLDRKKFEGKSSNGFHVKHMGIEKIKILGTVLELPAKQHCQSSHLPQTWAKLAKSAVLFSW